MVSKSWIGWKPLTETEFRWKLNEDEMASELVAAGIRSYASDACALEGIFNEVKEKKKQNDTTLHELGLV